MIAVAGTVLALLGWFLAEAARPGHYSACRRSWSLTFLAGLSLAMSVLCLVVSLILFVREVGS